jgi:hypothetical protein
VKKHKNKFTMAETNEQSFVSNGTSFPKVKIKLNYKESNWYRKWTSFLIRILDAMKEKSCWTLGLKMESVLLQFVKF